MIWLSLKATANATQNPNSCSRTRDFIVMRLRTVLHCTVDTGIPESKKILDDVGGSQTSFIQKPLYDTHYALPTLSLTRVSLPSSLLRACWGRAFRGGIAIRSTGPIPGCPHSSVGMWGNSQRGGRVCSLVHRWHSGGYSIHCALCGCLWMVSGT